MLGDYASGTVYVTAVPERQISPASLSTVVRRLQIGLSSRTPVTSTRPVISSPTSTAFTKRHSTPRNTVPGPGKSSATTAFSIQQAGGDASLHDQPPERRAR